MKLLKIEKYWLFLVMALFALFNIPGLPTYNNPVLAVIHAFFTIVPLWIAVYAGLEKVYKKYRIKK